MMFFVHEFSYFSSLICYVSKLKREIYQNVTGNSKFQNDKIFESNKILFLLSNIKSVNYLRYMTMSTKSVIQSRKFINLFYWFAMQANM